MSTAEIIDAVLDPFTECLSPDAARTAAGVVAAIYDEIARVIG